MAEDLKNLKLKRDSIKAQLHRFQQFYLTIQTSDLNQQNITQLEVRLAKIEPCFAEFDEIQFKIEIIRGDSDDDPLSEYTVRENFEKTYFELITNVKLTIATFYSEIENKARQNNQTIIKQERNEQVKLPVIKLPTFRGSYTQWLEFRDSFNALVHMNENISDIQKYYYLKSSLEGEASHIIQSITVSAVNYKIAWDLLCERYENKRLIIHHHLKAIFEQPILNKESHVKLRQLFDNISKNLRSINSLGLKTEEWDTIVIYIISSKFESITRRDWESFETLGDLPTMSDMNKFLKTKCEILEQLDVNKFENNDNKNTASNSFVNKTKNRGQLNTYAGTNQSNNNTCLVCKKDHLIYKCDTFLNLSVNDRINQIRKLGACLNCLRKNHLVKDCRSVSCFKCNNKHHTLLHQTASHNKAENRNSEIQGTTAESVQGNNQTNTNTSVLHSLDGENLSQVILSTAQLQIYDKWGKSHIGRALLDSASQSTIITTDLCKQLGLNKTKSKSTISGINQTKANVEYQTWIKIESSDGSFHTTVRTLVIPKITEQLPSVSFDYSCLNLPGSIQLADPTFNKRGDISILLGANVYWDLLCDKTIHLGKNKPNLQLTHLGWVIGGNLNCGSPQSNLYSTYFSLETLNKNVVKFWEIENCSNSKPLLSESENYCEEHFKQTIERNEQGRFVVNIPFKDNLQNLGESRDTALKRLLTMEKKLNRDSGLKNQYDSFMRDYLALGHMTKIQETEMETGLVCYLPHHAVVKDTSLTTKVRVVFDASAKTTSGLSLNETQLVGPTVQNDLISILISFRWHNFVLSGDIAMMYRQILVQPSQRQLQRILWRFNINDKIDCYQLNTVTYGTASAPYLATRCLEQLAIEHEQTHPEICNIIRKHTYMDDVLTGSETIEDILTLQRALSNIFLSAGFELRKWQTNVPNLVNDFKLSNENLDSNIINLSDNQTGKTLGIYWNSHLDVIKYSVSNHKTWSIITKRVILAEVSQIFDPLGFLAPVIIVAKLLIQKLWQSQITWDEPVPTELKIEWLDFSKQISIIIELDIPRQVTQSGAVFYELHGFADSSEKAFGACIYVRTKLNSGYITKLLCAKSRVAPLKSINLPRLELCAAQLLANLIHKVVDSLDITFKNIFYWSDSTITLCWIKGPPNKWKTFVANRVSEIQSLTDVTNWHHVRSADNPADLITRGVPARDILNSKFWFEGPSWLPDDQSQWPESNFNSLITSLPEERQTTVSLTVTAAFCCILTAAYAAIAPGQNAYLPPKQGYDYPKPPVPFPGLPPRPPGQPSLPGQPSVPVPTYGPPPGRPSVPTSGPPPKIPGYPSQQPGRPTTLFPPSRPPAATIPPQFKPSTPTFPPQQPSAPGQPPAPTYGPPSFPPLRPPSGPGVRPPSGPGVRPPGPNYGPPATSPPYRPPSPPFGPPSGPSQPPSSPGFPSRPPSGPGGSPPSYFPPSSPGSQPPAPTYGSPTSSPPYRPPSGPGNQPPSPSYVPSASGPGFPGKQPPSPTFGTSPSGPGSPVRHPPSPTYSPSGSGSPGRHPPSPILGPSPSGAGSPGRHPPSPTYGPPSGGPGSPGGHPPSPTYTPSPSGPGFPSVPSYNPPTSPPTYRPPGAQPPGPTYGPPPPSPPYQPPSIPGGQPPRPPSPGIPTPPPFRPTGQPPTFKPPSPPYQPPSSPGCGTPGRPSCGYPGRPTSPPYQPPTQSSPGCGTPGRPSCGYPGRPTSPPYQPPTQSSPGCGTPGRPSCGYPGRPTSPPYQPPTQPPFGPTSPPYHPPSGPGDRPPRPPSPPTYQPPTYGPPTSPPYQPPGSQPPRPPGYVPPPGTPPIHRPPGPPIQPPQRPPVYGPPVTTRPPSPPFPPTSRPPISPPFPPTSRPPTSPPFPPTSRPPSPQPFPPSSTGQTIRPTYGPPLPGKPYPPSGHPNIPGGTPLKPGGTRPLQPIDEIPSEGRPIPSFGENDHLLLPHKPGNPFEFKYAVRQPEFGNDYSHNAINNGDRTNGEYRVHLPDGRTQVVKYTADWATGYHAKISYEGNPPGPGRPFVPSGPNEPNYEGEGSSAVGYPGGRPSGPSFPTPSPGRPTAPGTPSRPPQQYLPGRPGSSNQINQQYTPGGAYKY